MELTDKLGDLRESEIKKISDSKIELGSHIYDVNSKKFVSLPTEILQSWNKQYYIVDEKYYFLNDLHEFVMYDPETQDFNLLDIQEL